MRSLLGGDESLCRFQSLDLREVPPDANPAAMGFHRDSGAEDTPQPGRTDFVVAITYLSDVDEHTPALCVVPRSHHCRLDPPLTHAEARAELEARNDYSELPLRLPAGSTVICDVTTFHRRADPPADAAGAGRRRGGRRTLHRYYSRAPAPPRLDWLLYPRRLALHPDPDTRRFFSNWSARTREWAAAGFSDSWLAANAGEVLLWHLGGEAGVWIEEAAAALRGGRHAAAL